mmetsp:Transcript_41726/g.69695  ORF Transcript_41726/g.69695 Transcript_41726/m.69695 type:complete len:83 (+) Transcript_41726:617-865(+)
MLHYKRMGIKLHAILATELVVHFVVLLILRYQAQEYSNFYNDLDSVPLRFRTEQHFMQLQIIRVGALMGCHNSTPAFIQCSP